MRWVPVESTSLDCIGYGDEVLEVRFNNGGICRYFGVLHGPPRPRVAAKR